jgi:WD40 repeat protein
MSFSDDGSLMSSGNIGNWLRIWKPLERKMLQELFAHEAKVTATCFGNDNTVIYSGGLDGKIIHWKKGATPPAIPPVIKPPEIKKKPDTVKVEQKQVTKTIPGVEMTSDNVPKIISGRKVVSDLKVEVASPNLTIYVYDNSYFDGDTMSLFFNGTWILDHYGVTKKKFEVSLTLTPNTNNYLVLFANNLGKSPPNTAAIEFNDGKTKRVFKMSSDLKSCSAVNFYYKK